MILAFNYSASKGSTYKYSGFKDTAFKYSGENFDQDFAMLIMGE